jgi:phosphosulfolactate synthase
MVMDKGLSIQQAEGLAESAGEMTDFVKFGFGTSLVTKNLAEKINIYKQAGIKPYFGGTLFEVFAIRNAFDSFRSYLDKYQIEVVEVSDGSMEMVHDNKLNYIEQLNKHFTVLSEVGSKKAGVDIPVDEWVGMMQKELQAGSWKVITEARESGTIGIFNKDGSANTELIDDIINHINPDDVIWEAPNKKQQVWFVQLLGSNVNLGNVAWNEVIALETLRLGLRGDTFFDFLPEELLA